MRKTLQEKPKMLDGYVDDPMVDDIEEDGLNGTYWKFKGQYWK
jgi:hypothetical protein